MAKQVTCYRSDSGKDFPTEHEALKEDLRHFIHNVIANEALSKQLTDAMVNALKPRYAPGAPKGAEPEWHGMHRLISRLTHTLPDEQHELQLNKPDPRPAGCRNRLADEGKPHPRSGCAIEGCVGALGVGGCPYERCPNTPPGQDFLSAE